MLFATTPPPSLYGGYPCFVISLCWIGAVTLVVSEAATIFGCVVGLTDACTAATIVALGARFKHVVVGVVHLVYVAADAAWWIPMRA